ASVISVWAPGLACRCLLHAPPPSPTLFPYTTLFRSGARGLDQASRAPVAKPDDQSFIGEQRARRFLAGFDDGEVANVRRERRARSEEHTSELQSRENLVCRLLLEKKKCLRQRARVSL